MNNYTEELIIREFSKIKSRLDLMEFQEEMECYPIKLTTKEKLKSEVLNQCRICQNEINDIILKLHFEKNKKNHKELNNTLSYLISEKYFLERKVNYLENNQ